MAVPADFFGPRDYTPGELAIINAAAKRHEDEAVARLYLDMARFERGER